MQIIIIDPLADRTRNYNVYLHGVCFMFIFLAFQTSENVQTDVLNNVYRDGKQIFKNKGYVSLSIIYATFSVCNFLAPPVVALLGPRITMIVGAATYVLFICSIIQPYLWTLYVASIIIGLGAALIWTAQGNFITLNSNAETMGRNSGIFWALLQCSLLFGNMFVYFYFKGTAASVTDHQRIVLYTVLAVCCGIGTLLLVLLRRPPPPDTVSSNGDVRSEVTQGPIAAFKKSFELLMTTDMLLLVVTMAYTGFELTFFSGVYGTSVGNVLNLRDRHRQVGLIGMMIGVGEITGGTLFGIFGKKAVRYGRDPVILLGFLAHMVTYYLVFLNLPDESPVNATSGTSWLNYNLEAYSLGAFLLGFGDASYNTQIYATLGTVYADNSAPAFALFKCVQSVAAAIAFAYATKLVLKWQLLILVIFGFAGTLTYIRVERRQCVREAGYEPIN